MSRLTEKQERFCRAYLETGNASQAYRLAYDTRASKPTTVNRSAAELMDNPKIAARIAELRQPVVERAQYSLMHAMRDARGAYEVAKKKGNGGAMVAAATLMAKLHGLLVERREVRASPLDNLTTIELLEIEAMVKQLTARKVQ